MSETNSQHKLKRKIQNKDIEIPRDTLGNVLPFPVPAYKICRMKPEEWEGMWMKEALGTLPAEADCSICGEYFQLKELLPLDRKMIHPTIQRCHLNTTIKEVRICKQCKAHCNTCKGVIPQAQRKQMENLCQVCFEEEKSMSRLKRKRK